MSKFQRAHRITTPGFTKPSGGIEVVQRAAERRRSSATTPQGALDRYDTRDMTRAEELGKLGLRAVDDADDFDSYWADDASQYCPRCGAPLHECACTDEELAELDS